MLNKQGQTIYGKNYIQKESSKRFFNGTPISITGRIGYGIVSLHGSYQVTSVLREGFGADMNRFTMGFTISGL